MQIIRSEKFIWIDIKGPTQKDIDYLQQNFDLHPLVLKEILPQIDYPKIENYGNYLFLVVFYPFFDKEISSTLPFEVDFIVGHNFLITNHYRDIVPLSVLLHQCNLYPENLKSITKGGSPGLLYRLLNEIFMACFPKLSHIKQNIDAIERMIFSQENKKAIEQISLVKRDIIGFQRVLDPQLPVLKKMLEECEKFFKGSLFIPYLHNLLSVYEQARSILETHHHTLLVLDSTNQSYIETRTNDIMKALTIFLVLLYPFSFFADLLSMNGQFLLWTAHPSDFWKVYGLMITTCLIIFAFLKKKKWM